MTIFHVKTFSAEHEKAKIESEFNYKACCNDNTGLQVLGTQVYQPRTCSKRTCFYDQSVASSLWISEEVILYRPFKHPKNNKRLLPDLVAA